MRAFVFNLKFSVFLRSLSNHFDLTFDKKDKAKQNALPRAELKVY